MPNKSRHSKRKYSTPSKIGKEKHHSLGMTTGQPITAQTLMPAHLGKKDSRVSMATPSAKPTAEKYQYIIAEVRRIGILAGIIILILIVLALVLPKT